MRNNSGSHRKDNQLSSPSNIVYLLHQNNADRLRTRHRKALPKIGTVRSAPRALSYAPTSVMGFGFEDSIEITQLSDHNIQILLEYGNDDTRGRRHRAIVQRRDHSSLLDSLLIL